MSFHHTARSPGEFQEQAIHSQELIRDLRWEQIQLHYLLKDYSKKEVTLGVRPSSFSTDVKAGAPIDLRLVVSEYLGAQSTLVTKCGEAEVLVEHESSSPVRAGGVLKFGVRTEELMVFDKETELRL